MMNWVLSIFLSLAASYGLWYVLTMEWFNDFIQNLFLSSIIGFFFGLVLLFASFKFTLYTGRMIAAFSERRRVGVVMLLHTLLFAGVYLWSIAPKSAQYAWVSPLYWIYIVYEAYRQIHLVRIAFSEQRAENASI